jgi:dienelactone hydrolase
MKRLTGSSAAEALGILDRNAKLAISGRIDLNRVGAFGHSIGGAAAVSAATDNPKIKAAVNLDGDYSGETAAARPEQAIFYLTTEPPAVAGAPFEKWDEERNEIRRKAIWGNIAARSKTAYRVRAARMFHTNFQDAALLPAVSMPENLRRDRFGAIDGARGVRIATDLVRAFFESELSGKPAADFTNFEKQYPEIKFEIKSAVPR